MMIWPKIVIQKWILWFWNKHTRRLDNWRATCFTCYKRYILYECTMRLNENVIQWRLARRPFLSCKLLVQVSCTSVTAITFLLVIPNGVALTEIGGTLTLNEWVSRGLTSHSTLYRSFRWRFLQARWSNQQHQSTEGSQLATEIGFSPTRTTTLCYNMN